MTALAPNVPRTSPTLPTQRMLSFAAAGPCAVTTVPVVTVATMIKADNVRRHVLNLRLLTLDLYVTAGSPASPAAAPGRALRCIGLLPDPGRSRGAEGDRPRPGRAPR